MIRVNCMNINGAKLPLEQRLSTRRSLDLSTVETGYNDSFLYDTSPITSDVLWYQLIADC
jgi:hypothetical protein